MWCVARVTCLVHLRRRFGVFLKMVVEEKVAFFSGKSSWNNEDIDDTENMSLPGAILIVNYQLGAI